MLLFLLLKAEILDEIYQSDSRIRENFTGSYKDAFKIYNSSSNNSTAKIFNLDQINASALLSPSLLKYYLKSKIPQA